MSAMVDLRGQLTGFRELFYVVLAEKERIINIFTFLHLGRWMYVPYPVYALI
jgi:hypothetical protein